MYSGVQLSFYTYYVSPFEIGVLCAKITNLKSHSMALVFWLQTGMDILNEALSIDFDQGVANISEVKVGG